MVRQANEITCLFLLINELFFVSFDKEIGGVFVRKMDQNSSRSLAVVHLFIFSTSSYVDHQ